MANKAGVEGGGGKLLGRGYYDSRLAMANDTCADCSCLDMKDVKSLKFVALVFLGREAIKQQHTPLLRFSQSE